MRSLNCSAGLRPYLSALAVALALPASAFCQGYVLSAPSADNNPDGTVIPGALQIGVSRNPGGAIPPCSELNDNSFWRVTVYRPVNGRMVTDPLVVSPASPLACDAATGTVHLATNATYSLNANTSPIVVEVEFLGGQAVATSLFPRNGTPIKPAAQGGNPPSAPNSSNPAQPASGSVAGCGPAAGPQPASGFYTNYCLSGTWVPQVGSHPLYSTDSNFVLAHSVPGSGMFGLAARESVASSIVLDPNAFASSVFYKTFIASTTSIPHLSSVIFNWNLATVEFDRKKKNTNLGTNVNLVTAPQFDFPIYLPRGFGAELDTGVEFGHNFKNNTDLNGFGTVFRGLLGVQLMYIRAPASPKSRLKTFKAFSQYQGRFLADDEVITRSIQGTLKPFEGHQTRNWVSTEFDFMFTKNFGLTLRHDYGELPPGFVVIENRATVGIVVQSAPK